MLAALGRPARRAAAGLVEQEPQCPLDDDRHDPPGGEIAEKDRMPAGLVTNTVGFPLTDCLLCFGRWAYRLGDLAPGESAEVGPACERRDLTTLLTGRRFIFEEGTQRATPYDRGSVDVQYILRAMMFFKAAGGHRYTGLVHRHQGFVDLSDLLKTDRAILVAIGPHDDPQSPSHGAATACATASPGRPGSPHDDLPLRAAGREKGIRDRSSVVVPVRSEITASSRDRAGDSFVIKTQDLTKVYGELRAIDNLTLELTRGDVYGFIGPNGSGKTTTMRILATLLQPTWGEGYVCDYSIYTHPKEIRRLIGFMPDFFGVYDDMKVIEYLEFFAAAYRIRGPKRRKVCDDMLALVGLDYKRGALVTSLSRGMTQRLGLARVLLHDPQVLLVGRAGQRPRPPGPDRDPRPLARASRAGQDDHGLQPHPPRAGRRLQQDRHHRARASCKISAEVTDVMRQVRRQPLLHIGVCGKLDEAAKLLEGHPIVEKVEVRDSHLLRHAPRRHPGLQRPADAAGPGRLQAHRLQGRRNQPRNRLHGPDQRHHGVDEEVPYGANYVQSSGLRATRGRRAGRIGAFPARHNAVPIARRGDGVRDRLWLFANPINSTYPHTLRRSVVSPAEGAFFLGIPNVIDGPGQQGPGGRPRPVRSSLRAIRGGPAAAQASPLVAGRLGRVHHGRRTQRGPGADPQHAELRRDLSRRFLHPQLEDKRAASRSPEFLIRETLRAGGRKLEIHVTFYTDLLALPLADYLELIDSITLWTWRPEDLANLAANLAGREARSAPQGHARRVTSPTSPIDDDHHPLGRMHAAMRIWAFYSCLRARKRIEGRAWLDNGVTRLG